jgi:hypothetical protein
MTQFQKCGLLTSFCRRRFCQTKRSDQGWGWFVGDSPESHFAQCHCSCLETQGGWGDRRERKRKGEAEEERRYQEAQTSLAFQREIAEVQEQDRLILSWHRGGGGGVTRLVFQSLKWSLSQRGAEPYSCWRCSEGEGQASFGVEN